MATIDIREAEQDVTAIVYCGDNVTPKDAVYKCSVNAVELFGELIYKCDIDNLILALQKAKELWFTEE